MWKVCASVLRSSVQGYNNRRVLPLLSRHLSSATPGATEPGLTVSSQHAGIRTITLNNPRKRNALSLAMLESLRRDLLTGGSQDDLQVIIIAAEGPVFSAGHDLNELSPAHSREKHTEIFDACTRVMTLVQDLPVPVIAKVQGLATAAGCQLVASCDIVVASDTAQFATPGVKVGLFCSTPAVALGRAVPRKVAMEMLFTGQPITAQDALLHGLVSKVVPESKLDEETHRLAQQICTTSRSVTAIGKACFYSQITKSRDEAYREAGEVMVDNLQTEDGREGISAFLEKRKPTWSHR
ncbi:PREDICTED: enoyl-CoA hydratase domain-containing protein 3, mitochondrial-like isoform X1 [Branchiostoma belcheri]|uniref:Enoyl-CoA hydratase domain-containing protein 3, mitochondrial n=1 Tax=Branchiostoma belcheri TaxID=7741 RepID=A0A6P4YUR0_BRABE|nr:PREDICTED: enoyl-CoA hydratase domain-containing protein 3, mitochondrial-like isoform X1 [Branchiostoma belcheri]